ncbi:hypothetical protein [Micromonospora sp. NPDC003776]
MTLRAVLPVASFAHLVAEAVRVARRWLSIRVELVSGRGEDFWPRPGRIFAAVRAHTFEQLGAAIDDAFARWDLAHLRLFTLTDETAVCSFRVWDEPRMVQSTATRPS